MSTQPTSPAPSKKGMVVSDHLFAEAFADLADPNDPGSIGVLVDFVLQHNNICIPPLPDEVEEQIRSKLVQEEVAYRQGRGPGVDEQKLADAWNFIAARLGFPEPAYTSQRQLHLVRMQRSIFLPRLMDLERLDRGDLTLSPLQAAVVVKDLLVLKRTMPWYWVAAAEWDATRYGEGMRNCQDSRVRLSEHDGHKIDILKADFARNPSARDVVIKDFRSKMPIPYYPLPIFSALDSAEQMNLVREAFDQLGRQK